MLAAAGHDVDGRTGPFPMAIGAGTGLDAALDPSGADASRGLLAFGVGIPPADSPDGRTGRVSYARTSDGNGAPTLDLDVSGHLSTVIRDYPDWVGPMTSPEATGDEVGDINWPMNVSPGDLKLSDRLRVTWTKDQIARRVPARWAAWERRAITAQRAQAVRMVGPCATRTALAGSWSTIDFGDFGEPAPEPLFDAYGNQVNSPRAEPGSQRFFLIAVNGLGGVRRFELRPDGTATPSTMTAANPGGRS